MGQLIRDSCATIARKLRKRQRHYTMPQEHNNRRDTIKRSSLYTPAQNAVTERSGGDYTEISMHFTNSPMEETIYCACPEGFQESGKCWLLQRALYGLQILWFKEFSSTL